jgi:uncharacterized protein YjbI with pentapeptide repeats
MKHLKDYLTLESMNLSGLNLSSSNLGNMSIENVNLAGARLVNANFSCSDLTRVDFSGAKLMNARFDYSNCEGHISTRRPQCSKEDWAEVNDAKSPFFGTLPLNKIICLEGSFVGADFSEAQIRGYKGRRDLNMENCEQLLVLVGDMSGANFKKAGLTCVAFINRPATSGIPSSNQSMKASFNGISFADARLDRVALLKGPFRFTQFERANLMGLFVNINPNKVDLDYSRLNEIKCKAPAKPITNSKTPVKLITYLPCLWVQHDLRDETLPLRLNFLWSTIVTNLKPSYKDMFLCTPDKDLPAWIEDRAIESAGYWLSATGWPTADRKPLNCPVDSKEAEESVPRQQSHVLSPRITAK